MPAAVVCRKVTPLLHRQDPMARHGDRHSPAGLGLPPDRDRCGSTREIEVCRNSCRESNRSRRSRNRGQRIRTRVADDSSRSLAMAPSCRSRVPTCSPVGFAVRWRRCDVRTTPAVRPPRRARYIHAPPIILRELLLSGTPKYRLGASGWPNRAFGHM